MNILDATLLGILQGVTEFLPISSSGHLILAEYFFHLKGADLAFDVMLHMGTLIAVLIYFFNDWLFIAQGILPNAPKQRRLLIYVILGTIPGAVIGFLLEHKAETIFRSPWVIVCTLGGVALLLLWAEKVARHSRNFEKLTLKDAILIGISQAAAIVPGVSRSGITMTTALFLGLDRPASAKFSFLLSAPIIAGAGLYEGIKILHSGGIGNMGYEYIAGFLAAAISGYIVIAFLMRFLTTHTFKPFAYYRIILAAIVALLLFSNISPAWGYTTTERISMRTYRQYSPAIVNITSTPLATGFALSPSVPKGSVTGFIIDNHGHILTLSHLIIDPHRLEITLSDGENWPATMIGMDKDTDIALLKINAPPNTISRLTYLNFNPNAMPAVGQQVFIFGNAFALHPSMFSGTISMSDKPIKNPVTNTLIGLIQINCSVNAQDAGGPVLNTSGKVIGMLTEQYSTPGIGYAIPSSILSWTAKQLISKGRVSHAWLGASVISLTPALANVLNISVSQGALICQVSKNSPAAKAGLRPCDSTVSLGNINFPMGGDVIVSMDGQKVTSAESLLRMLRFKKSSATVRLGIYRNGRFMRIDVHLKPRP